MMALPRADNRDLLVLVPAFNEAGAVADVVRSARQILACAVLVIDDGSTDRTAAVARAEGAMVAQLPFNCGVGAAVRTGLRYAAVNGYRRVVQLDGDGQHLATEAKRLLDRLDEGDVDLVVGSRFGAAYQLSGFRRAAIRLLARMTSKRLGTPIRDSTSGFRAFGPRALDVFAAAYPSSYLSDTVEALLIAASQGLRVVEVEATFRDRQAGTPSAGRFRGAGYFLRIVFVILLHRIRQPLAPRGVS
jgi:glycosyltransferase involved in cell wall biosynthesis